MISRKYLKTEIYENHLINNRYIDNTIKQFIKIQNGELLTYKLPYQPFHKQEINEYITINFFLYKNFVPLKLKNIDNYVFNMMRIIYLISNLTQTNCSIKGINISIFMSPFKRELNSYLT